MQLVEQNAKDSINQPATRDPNFVTEVRASEPEEPFAQRAAESSSNSSRDEQVIWRQKTLKRI